MRIDLSAAAALRVGGHDIAEVMIAGRRVWPRPDPLVTRLTGVGYAGSTYQVAHAGAGRWQYDTGGGWSDFAPAQVAAVLTTALAQDGAAISWLRDDDGARSNVFARLWTPYAMPALAGVFDIRRVAAGATSWAAAAGGMSYTQSNAAIRPVYEPAGLGGKPCFFSDWNRVWAINGLMPAPGARTFMGLFAFAATDPSNWFRQISGPVGSWSLLKSYPNPSKRQLAIGRSENFADWHTSGVVITDNEPCLISTKTRRPSGEWGFRFNGAPTGGGTQPVAAYTDGAGAYSLNGYIRLGSHAYVDALVSDADNALFEGWCAWTQGFVALLPAGHLCESTPPLAL